MIVNWECDLVVFTCQNSKIIDKLQWNKTGSCCKQWHPSDFSHSGKNKSWLFRKEPYPKDGSAFREIATFRTFDWNSAKCFFFFLFQMGCPQIKREQCCLHIAITSCHYGARMNCISGVNVINCVVCCSCWELHSWVLDFGPGQKRQVGNTNTDYHKDRWHASNS